MESKKYLDDISEIRNMMSRSSRFISLSGLSGILAGVYALAGAAVAYTKLKTVSPSNYEGLSGRDSSLAGTDFMNELIYIAMTVVVLAILTGILLSYRKAHKSGESVWNVASRRLVLHFLIPLVTGGIFCLVLIQYGFFGLVAPATLIFYGLACVNASKYTLGDVLYMGLAFIIVGLINTQFIGYGLYFWALGFGIFHMLYGAIMYFKYDRH